ncbi:DNA repair protein RAD50-like [Limulus polyphemus]|uniref:DNA repair protein RAD50-like n=1 Tax=Limulus polyphemus TaxID=6850 RepID=A0ABM1B7N8_LIMPO|nr:DNA repair protein RAD50-like [Limulus polyphemus]
MSYVEKMSIMGIRSFGPYDKDKQVISFFIPLTLILGPNGSGKTTIIECLKYITTGDMPPNCGRGGSFVHDPKVAREQEVKGQIKLQFQDVLGKQAVLTRSIVAIQKQKKIETRTLEGVISRRAPNGEKISMSSKCAQIDKEMISNLGVSKAVLNNVIFCHQEESNWPLSEGKALKQKFDEIFAATRYIKALDNIKKIRTEKLNNVKHYQTELKFLKQNKDKAIEIKEDLGRTQTRLSSCKDRVNEVEEKLRPIYAKLELIAEREEDINNLQTEMNSNKEILKHLENSYNDLHKNIKNIFHGTVDELQQELKDYQTVLERKQASFMKQKRKLQECEQECGLITKNKSLFLVDIGRLTQEQQQHQEKIEQRDSLVMSLSRQFGEGIFSESGSPLQEEKVQKVVQCLQQRLEIAEQDLRRSKVKFATEEKDLQKRMEIVREQKIKLDQKNFFECDQLSKNREEVREITREVKRIDTSANKLKDLEQDQAQMEEELKEVEVSVDINSIKSNIVGKQKQLSIWETQISNLNVEMDQMQLEGKVRAEIDILQKEKMTKEENLRRLQGRNEDTITHLLGKVELENLRNTLEDYLNSISREVQELSKELSIKKSKLSSLETTKNFQVEQLHQKEKELKYHQERVNQISGKESFDETLEFLQSSIKSLHDEKGSLIGSQYIYSKYVEKLQRENPCCPLCQRHFEEDQESKDLLRDVQRKLQMIPSQLDIKQRNLTEQQERLDKMLELRPVREAMVELSEKKIPDVKIKISQLNKEIESLLKDITEMEETLDAKQMDRETAASIQPDVILLDQSNVELQRTERKVKTLKCKLSGEDTSRTVQQVSDERNHLQKESESVRRHLDMQQKIIHEHQERIQNLREQIHQVHTKKFQISGDLQKRLTLEERANKLMAENSKLEQCIHESKEKVRKLDKQIENLQDESKQLTESKEHEFQMLQNKLKTKTEEKSSLDNLNDKITQFANSGKLTELKDKQTKLQELQEKLNMELNKFKTINSDIQKLNEELSSQEMKKRELQDNLELKKIEDDMSNRKIKMEVIEEKLGTIDATSFYREKQRLVKDERNLTGERQQAEGRKRELEEIVRKQQKELEEDMYKNAEKLFQTTLIQLRTTELASDDLNKYYTALDKAVMHYHNMKMDEINKIIRELWIKTYRGNDIDYIEIRSDEEEGGASLDKQKRTYNYRVVMVKGDTSLDMRGRCSAGQKVLASLIIRLALAETFCLNCGILALDEPTTNLDRDNIESLAHALVEIVKFRSQQKNFQLIIITHDEDFIELLGRSDAVEYFYKVSKNHEGKSQLSKCVFGEVTR